ncbi:MAG: stage II sporulation protein M [Marinilabiliaceae bacterium]|nr:stage II sporulation protein M [Marinilabiliaceae bacterium]
MKQIFFFLSFALWTLSFIIRLSVHIEPVVNDNGGRTNKVVENIIEAADNNDDVRTFELIFINNIKGCAINVLGGVLLSVATIVNLLINGLAAADVFRSTCDAGFSLSTMLKATLPHSFELVGFWLSGTVGFMITWQMIRFMTGKEAFSMLVLKQMGTLLFVTVIIILCAAYVEAYISMNIMK